MSDTVLTAETGLAGETGAPTLLTELLTFERKVSIADQVFVLQGPDENEE
jgi:hypothetical protein